MSKRERLAWILGTLVIGSAVAAEERDDWKSFEVRMAQQIDAAAESAVSETLARQQRELTADLDARLASAVAERASQVLATRFARPPVSDSPAIDRVRTLPARRATVLAERAADAPRAAQEATPPLRVAAQQEPFGG